VDHGLPTVAEASGYTRTAYHREVVSFLDRLAARSDRVRLTSAGRSGLGQELVCAVASRDRVFTPAAARASGLPVVLVIANIHAGEVEGKEASLMLLRDVALGTPLAPLLERCVLLVLPDYNPDGNDRIDPSHRALDMARLEGQVGPEGGVGTRTTGTGDTGASRSAMKREPTHTSSTPSNARRQRPGKTPTSHHQRPMTRRPPPSSCSASRAPAMPSGLTQTSVTSPGPRPPGSAASPRAARAIGVTTTPACSSASRTLRAAAPRPELASR